MKAGVGYSENPDTRTAGKEVAESACRQAAQSRPCDLVLLFATSRHNAKILREAVADVVGAEVPIVGGGAVGAITNERFGYAGDQIAMAAIWFEAGECHLYTEGGLSEDEVAAGERLGRQFAEAGIKPDTSMVLFYNAIQSNGAAMSMIMATYLLAGIEKGLGFLPDISGAGLMGDFMGTPAGQYTGSGVGTHHALALAFGGGVQVDSAVMHGCKPASCYYTVTKADKQTILEINGQPALSFVRSLMGSAMSPEEYPFFLIFGVNKGEKWAEFDDNAYANRLCLAIDKERDGIVMFEPDMTEGTEFQIMQRSLDLNYIPPKIEQLFTKVLEAGRDPVFAIYIDCAGRAGGTGIEKDDAEVVQQSVNGRVPLLGLYTGVEIAAIEGAPRGLDWTGVFCLFSIAKK